MNVIEALAAARDGKVVRRKAWEGTPAHGLYYEAGSYYFERGTAKVSPPSFSLAAVLADDWIAE